MKNLALSALALSLAAGAANAAFVSFASDGPQPNDTGHERWTFGGFGANVTDGGAPSFTLNADDNNGPLVPIQFANSQFIANFQIAFAGVIPQGASRTYVYSIAGNFTVGPLAGQGFNGTMTALGTQVGNFQYWGSTATIQFSNLPGQLAPGSGFQHTWNGPALPPPYDMPIGLSAGPDDAAFTLTVLHASSAEFSIPGSGGIGVLLNPETHLPAFEWLSEGSFSGQLHAPTPGAASLITLGGLLAARRRRAV